MKKILVVQFRTDISEMHDQTCIAATISEYADSICFVSAVKGILAEDILDDAAAIIFSGSGEFFLGKGDGEDTWLPQTFLFLEKAMERHIPVLGICFGHQIILLHEGAEVKQIEACREVGSLPIFLSDKSSEDPIFSQLPRTFKGMLGHKETPVNIPDHIEVLASSERVIAQATRIKGKDVWSTMFHPELTKSRMKDRLLMFPSYVQDPTQLDATMALFEDAPEAGTVIRAFVQYAYIKMGVELVADPPVAINF